MPFTYEFPEAATFLHTLRELLEAEKRSDLAGLLVGVSCEFGSDGQFSGRWNAYQARLILRAPTKVIPKFTEDAKREILAAADRVMPAEVGYDLRELEVSPFLESPPEGAGPLNTGALVSQGPLEHDGLRFRSRTETKIYDELKKRPVLFFPNATAVLGGKGIKREPDFLICMNGRWGILEVMGDSYHTPSNAMQDHDRARLFKDYEILVIEFYDAVKCYNSPASVVDDFLGRLAKA